MSASSIVIRLLENDEVDPSAYLGDVRPLHTNKNRYCPNCERVCSEADQEKAGQKKNRCAYCGHLPVYRVGQFAPIIREADEMPPTPDPLDTRSEVDRLLPTKTYRLGGNSMIHAPGLLRMAANEWRVGKKKQKEWAINVLRAWPGLPDEAIMAILKGQVEIETDGDNAVVTIKEY